MPDLRSYSLYGCTLHSDFPFENALVERSGPPQLRFACGPAAPPDSTDPGGFPPTVERGRLADGRPFLSIVQTPACDVIRYTDVADFYVRSDQIHCHVLDPEYAYAIEIYFLGYVMSYWLERYRNVLPLHAAAVVVEGAAVAFVATNKGGKSSLAATFMQQGHALLTDDILAVDRQARTYVGHSGYPQMRMWPDQARHFVGAYDELDLVHPQLTKRRVPVGPGGLGTFCSGARPLACLYVPERRDDLAPGAVEIRSLPLASSIRTLMENVFGKSADPSPERTSARFAFLGGLVSGVPVRSVVYSSGVEFLPSVASAVLADLREQRRHLARA